MTHTAYKGKRVLVTGHTGFKGSWLSLWLTRLGARVSGLALEPDTDPSLYTEARIGDRVESLIGDIRDPELVREAVAGFAPQIIFHLAAQPLVRRGYAEPLRTFGTNVMGTANVLEAARHTNSVKAIVVVTSDKCYREDAASLGYRESDPLGGHDPYSASKAAAELATSAWRASYGNTPGAPLIATARAGNVIGGGDWASDRLVPDLWRAARAGRTALIRNPSAIRPWQHVLEPLSGYLMLGARLLGGHADAADAWNFGPALVDMESVEALCEHMCPLLGASWSRDRSPQPREAPMLRLDSSKAMVHLGWQPRFNFEEAVALTGDWYKRHAAGEDARQLCEDRIERFERSRGRR
ncbi:MAG: CDP-glucose 4,6-dehydratase [Rhodocyclaceae bacterium]|nr:CDP-glucose 4,6-dehydratase [Rhodocyclaceae bacterium]